MLDGVLVIAIESTKLDGEDSRTLAAVGAFRVVPEHDLDRPRHPQARRNRRCALRNGKTREVLSGVW